MTFDERFYRTLVVSSSRKFNETLAPFLTAAHCAPVVYTDSAASAKRQVLESQFDFVIIHSPLPDEPGVKLATRFSEGRSTVCLLFVRAEEYSDIHAKVNPAGVFLLPLPTSSSTISHGLDFLASAKERLRKLEEKQLSIEEKMEEIRLVNRAKWLLIDRLKMAEPDAHRYIEKQAMDTCTSRREIANEIIRTYS